MNLTQVDYSRKWYVMLAVAMGIFLATIDGSIVNVALPSMISEFSTDFATVQWVILAYLLTLTSLLLSVGRLGDMIGKKSIYTLGFVIFTVGSVLCGLAPTVYWLIGFRTLQAIGATMILALGMAIVTEAFPPAERGKAIGITGTVVSIGIIVGPTLGGIILDLFSWHWIFFVNLPVGILGTWMVIRNVPTIKPIGGQQFDFLGAGLLFTSLLSFLFALTIGQQAGFQDNRVMLLFSAGFGLLLLFILTELRVPQPMVELRMFKNIQFSINLATGFISFIAIAGTTLLMPFYLQNILGFGIRQVGMLMAVVPVIMGVVAPISGNLSDRLGSRPITVIGLAVLLVGYFLLSTLKLTTSAYGYILRFIPIGLGMGIFQSPNNSAIMGTASRERLGIVSGMLAVTRTLGQTTGIAIVGALWAARVLSYNQGPLPQGATSALPAYQVSAMQDTFLLLGIMLTFALGLSIWALLQTRQKQKVPVAGSAIE